VRTRLPLASELLVAFAEDQAQGARNLEALFAVWRRRSAEREAAPFDAGVARRWLDAIYKDWPLLFACELNRHSSSWPYVEQLRPLIDCVLQPDEWEGIAKAVAELHAHRSGTSADDRRGKTR
jgi:hypothetical protein